VGALSRSVQCWTPANIELKIENWCGNYEQLANVTLKRLQLPGISVVKNIEPQPLKILPFDRELNILQHVDQYGAACGSLAQNRSTVEINKQ